MMARTFTFAIVVLVGTVTGNSLWAQPQLPDTQAQAGWEVYYQATYQDGSVRDLNTIPATKGEIIRLVRITYSQPDIQGYDVFSTGTYSYGRIKGGQTIRTALQWNGQAWVAPGEPPTAIPAQAQNDSEATAAEIKRVTAVLRAINHDAERRERRVVEAQNALAAAQTTDEKALAQKALNEAQQNLAQVHQNLQRYQTQLDALNACSQSQPVPSGQVGQGQLPEQGRQLAVDSPVDNARVLAHRVQVCKVPDHKNADGETERQISVSMPHAEAGPNGAFQYVAYADTDNDGTPDQKIAMSPEVSTDTPGAWSNWQFSTNQKNVYVGQTWKNPNTTVYFTPPPTPQGQDPNTAGITNQTYISGFYGGMPCWPSPFGGFMGNIQINETTPYGLIQEPSGMHLIAN